MIAVSRAIARAAVLLFLLGDPAAWSIVLVFCGYAGTAQLYRSFGRIQNRPGMNCFLGSEDAKFTSFDRDS